MLYWKLEKSVGVYDDDSYLGRSGVEHGLTKEEIEQVLQRASDADLSRSSGRPVVFGDTNAGRHLMVVYETIEAGTVYPITAYEVPRRIQ